MEDRVADWVALVDEAYPESDAASWDALGLQVGDPEAEVRAVLVCLDVTDVTLDEARERACDLVLAHHPLLFRPLARLTPSTAAGRLALRAAREGVALLAAHTNLDAAVPGTTDPIADVLGLVDRRPLAPLPAEPAGARLRLVAHVPPESTVAVVEALTAAGAGGIGEYTGCSFRVRGLGTFTPSADANPVAGERGRPEEVVEDRVEVVLPRAAAGAVVQALRLAHPYEEVAFSLVALVEPPAPGRAKGIGLVGALPTPVPLREVARALSAGLPSPHLRVAGDLGRPVSRVAACGGAGDSLMGEAIASGADVYVTGDLRHHVALDALAAGLALVDAGHFATEAPALGPAVDLLAEAAARRGLRAPLLRSAATTEPWAAWSPGTADDRRSADGGLGDSR